MGQDSCTNLQLAPNLHFLGIFFADYVSTNAPQAGGGTLCRPWAPGVGPGLSSAASHSDFFFGGAEEDGQSSSSQVRGDLLNLITDSGDAVSMSHDLPFLIS